MGFITRSRINEEGFFISYKIFLCRNKLDRFDLANIHTLAYSLQLLVGTWGRKHSTLFSS
jgi:hypothetical protein